MLVGEWFQSTESVRSTTAMNIGPSGSFASSTSVASDLPRSLSDNPPAYITSECVRFGLEGDGPSIRTNRKEAGVIASCKLRVGLG